TDQRLVFSTDGSTLTGGSGGGGGSVTWVGDITPQVVIGAGAEYQQIANAHWTTGNFSGALALGGGQLKTHLYIETHEGAGDVGGAGCARRYLLGARRELRETRPAAPGGFRRHWQAPAAHRLAPARRLPGRGRVQAYQHHAGVHRSLPCTRLTPVRATKLKRYSQWLPA